MKLLQNFNSFSSHSLGLTLDFSFKNKNANRFCQTFTVLVLHKKPLFRALLQSTSGRCLRFSLKSFAKLFISLLILRPLNRTAFSE